MFMCLFVLDPSCLPYIPPEGDSVTFDQPILMNGRYPERTIATVTCNPGLTQLGASVLDCSNSWNLRDSFSPSGCKGKDINSKIKLSNNLFSFRQLLVCLLY